jgi:hypothetical protein
MVDEIVLKTLLLFAIMVDEIVLKTLLLFASLCIFSVTLTSLYVDYSYVICDSISILVNDKLFCSFL